MCRGRPPAIRPARAAAFLLLALVFSGCAAPGGGAGNDAFVPGAAVTTRVGVTESRYVRTRLLPFGSVEYDRNTLPLVSPDGRFLAVASGVAPPLEAQYAAPDAAVPRASEVVIHELVPPDDSGVPRLERRHRVGEGLLLGRAADEEGFLVEAPQEDGSRWIGKVDWNTGATRWLVRDEFINAFATLGPGDALAWVRRPVGAEEQRFSLLLRTGAGEIEVPPPSGATWLDPVFSGSGDGVFVLRLADEGDLDVVHMHGSSAAAMRQSARSIRIHSAALRGAAYQTLAGFPSIRGVADVPRPRLAFFHPAYGRVAVWRPYETRRSDRLLLEEGSDVAVIDRDGFAVYAAGDQVKALVLDSEASPVILSGSYFVPYLTRSDRWPYVLVTPSESDPGRLKVAGMELLPVGRE